MVQSQEHAKTQALSLDINRIRRYEQRPFVKKLIVDLFTNIHLKSRQVVVTLISLKSLINFALFFLSSISLHNGVPHFRSTVISDLALNLIHCRYSSSTLIHSFARITSELSPYISIIISLNVILCSTHFLDSLPNGVETEKVSMFYI